MGQADIDQQGWTLGRPEAQGHVVPSERGLRLDGGQAQAAVPAEVHRFRDGVAHRRPRLEAGRHLWTERRRRWGTWRRTRTRTSQSEKLNKLLTFINVGESTGIIDANVDEVSS